MAARSDRFLDHILHVARTVEAAQTVTIGMVVKDGNADHECQPCTDGVGAYGVVMTLGALLGAAGDIVMVGLLAGSGVIPIKVGTGGATRGKWAKCVATGVTDATADVATPAGMDVMGIFMQSGVAGDIVGLMPARCWLTE